MSKNRTRYLNKPLSAWSNQEIMALVIEVNKVKGTPKAQPLIKQHMSLGTYARALRRVGLRPPKKDKMAKGCICQEKLELGVLVRKLSELLGLGQAGTTSRICTHI